MHPQLQEIINTTWGDKITSDEMKIFIRKVDEYYTKKEANHVFYEAIISASDDLAFEVDGKGFFLNAFVADESMLLSPSEKLIGKNIDELFEPPIKTQFNQALQEVLQSKSIYSVEFKSPFLDNYFIANFSYLKKSEKNNPHVLIQIRDVTAKKKAENKLLDSEEKFRNLIEAARDIFFTTDVNGYYTYVNEIVSDKIGYKPEELIGINFTQIVRPDFRRRVSIFYYHQIQNKTAFSYFEFPIVGKNGEKIWVGQNVQLLFKQGKFTGTQAVVRDITNIKNSELILKQSEERFRKLLQNSMDVITVLDENGNIIYDSFSIHTQFGYDKPITGTSVFSYFHPDDVQRAKEEFKKGLSKKGMTEPMEYRFMAADGTWRYLEILGNNLLDEPTIKGIVINSRDITERKRIEQTLLESEERFRKLVQYSSDVTTVVSIDGTITYISPSFFRIFGYKENVVGKNIFEFLHPDDLKQAQFEFQRGIEKGGVSDLIEFRFRMPGGEWKYFETIGNNLLNEPSIKGIVLNSREISERKKAEVALAQTSEQLLAIIESTTNAIFAIDKNYCYIAFNKAHKNIIKYIYNIHIEIGDSALIYSSIGDRDRDSMKEIFDRSFSGEQFTYIYETEILGQNKFYNISANPIKDENNIVTGVALFSENITKQKKVEEDLIRTKDEAIRASNAKSEFLSNMSHEIRTPMNAIVSLSDLLLEKKFDESTNEYLTTINKSVNNLLVIINDILDFSKIENGKVHLEKIDFNLHEKINEMNNFFKQIVEQKNLKLTIDIDANVPQMVNGDPFRLNQILVNLIGNAIKFTQKGSIEITVKNSFSNTEIDKITIDIQDTGIGIPEEKLDFIFESFTQAYNDIARTYGGTGLGLAITKKLIDLQNGIISVKSKINVGTLFIIELSYEKSKTAVVKSNQKAKIADKNLNGLRVLIVEDNKINQFVVKQIINKWNANITIANNGREAINMLANDEFDIVLMDLQMPEMSGFDATQIIRSKESNIKNKTIPIIALTADAFIETKEKVLEASMNDFVTKPINQEDLYSKIIKHIIKK